MKQHSDRQRLEAELAALFGQAARTDEELQASLARYACVLASGYLEASCREVVEVYCRDKAHPSVSQYVQRRMRRFNNPNVEDVLTLASDFGPEFRAGIETRLDDEIRDAVNSIYANRNNIAHGRQSGVSIARIKAYYECARKIHRYLAEQFQ